MHRLLAFEIGGDLGRRPRLRRCQRERQRRGEFREPTAAARNDWRLLRRIEQLLP
jgi:hypothetical protein